MRFAYADPPYPGQAEKHYGDDERCAEVNHPLLIAYLCEHFDGWALSTSSPALRDVLPLCPEGTRVMAWVKPFAAWKRNVNPSYAWEPVLVCGARPRPEGGPTYRHGFRDWVAESITMQRGFTGAKPQNFCWWLFEVLNVHPGDELVDVFPGSSAVTDALAAWWAYAGPWADTSFDFEEAS